MDILLKLWQITLKSNLFNFILMLLFLGWVIKKFNLADVLEQGRKQIEDNILNAKIQKEESEKEFSKTKSESKNVEKEAQSIIKYSEENAALVGERLIDSAKEQTKVYEKSVERTVNDTIKKIRLNLTSETALMSVEKAKKHIQSMLEKDRELHLKYINESIESLKEVNI